MLRTVQGERMQVHGVPGHCVVEVACSVKRPGVVNIGHVMTFTKHNKFHLRKFVGTGGYSRGLCCF